MRIQPFGPTSFSYHVGQVHVDYSAAAVAFSVPGDGRAKQVTIAGMQANAAYAVSTSGCPGGSTSATASATGDLVFSVPVGAACQTQVKLKNVRAVN